MPVMTFLYLSGFLLVSSIIEDRSPKSPAVLRLSISSPVNICSSSSASLSMRVPYSSSWPNLVANADASLCLSAALSSAVLVVSRSLVP